MDPATVSDNWIGRHLELRLTHHRGIGEVEDRAVEQWWATGTLDATDIDIDDVDDDDEIDVVRVHLVRCPLGNPHLWTLLDGLEGDLAAVGSVVLDLDTGDPADAVAELVGIGSHLLILNSVVCDKRFAGRHIGRWVAAEAIEALSPGVEFVAAVAAPMDSSEGAARARAGAKLREVWASIGFVEVEDSVMVLNPGMRTTYELLQDLRERFGVSHGQ